MKGFSQMQKSKLKPQVADVMFILHFFFFLFFFCTEMIQLFEPQTALR